eukprot:snap_masked-scaffold_3-processed-gene-20.23-mRNA-1 protein AED:0.42 eAED:1.00 QI:0/-1/0/1/-1/1/1/0/98
MFFCPMCVPLWSYLLPFVITALTTIKYKIYGKKQTQSFAANKADSAEFEPSPCCCAKKQTPTIGEQKPLLNYKGKRFEMDQGLGCVQRQLFNREVVCY